MQQKRWAMFELNNISIAVLLMGLRHGFDLDHLATIDAITRTTANNISISKSTGLLFSLGHGAVVIILSIIVGSGLSQFKPSHTLELFGEWVSIFFLFALGLMNLYNIFFFKTGSDQIKITQWVSRHLIKNHYQALSIFGIGALFAISFDTLSQIALLALSASTQAGWVFALVIGALFTLGMMLADGANGLLVAQVIFRGNRISVTASQIIGAIIALFSLITGTLGLVRLV
jgi:nickel/cobalt transporter (NiCoT) family protein